MLLWIPGAQETEEESNELIAKVTAANGAVLDFCAGDLALDDCLQIVEHCGADVDRYIADLAETLTFVEA